MFTVVAKRERPLGANLDPWDCAAKVQHYSTPQNYKKKGKEFKTCESLKENYCDKVILCHILVISD